MNTHEEYEKFAVMSSSGASETAASRTPSRRHSHQELRIFQQPESKQRTSSTLGRNTFESSMITARRVGPSSRCARDSVSTRYQEASALESGHSVVCRHPGQGSYTQNNSNGNRTYLRQESRSHYLHLPLPPPPPHTHTPPPPPTHTHTPHTQAQCKRQSVQTCTSNCDGLHVHERDDR